MAASKKVDAKDTAAPKEAEEAPARRYGLGYIPDEPDARDFSARALFGARRELPPEASLEGFVTLSDQDDTNSCTGHAIGGAIEARLAKLGMPRVLSRLAIYTVGRALYRFGADAPLRDEGASPRAVFRGIAKWGVADGNTWPFDPARINDELPWDVLREMSSTAITAWFRIDSFGKERIETICQALAAGYPVPFGLSVDRDFTKNARDKAKTPIGRQDESRIVGAHMMFACGYRTAADGSREIRIVNSWGEDWRDGGLAWVSEPFFAKATDLYVVQVS